MTSARVVIGANFGDEGKGLMTDYFASRSPEEVVVCRFNGGAQAGHTVVTPEGRRHVFSHYGSGTLAGASTYLSRHFITNPLLFYKERTLLRELHSAPVSVYADPSGLVSTPFDMLINRSIERSRGAARHGSCGVGINETVVRSEKYPVSVADLGDRSYSLRHALESIYREYVPARLVELGLDPAVSRDWPNSSAVIDQFLTARDEFLHSVMIKDPELIMRDVSVVFEGAQGLLLDQDHRYFPHVTRSKTGLANVVEIAEDLGIDRLDVTYVTRSYVTRHGAGPFDTEDLEMRHYDDTNAPSQWQGWLRFGTLDPDLLVDTISEDLNHETSVEFWPSIAVTHLDQFDLDPGVIDRIVADVGAEAVYRSHGPTRAHVTEEVL